MDYEDLPEVVELRRRLAELPPGASVERDALLDELRGWLADDGDTALAMTPAMWDQLVVDAKNNRRQQATRLALTFVGIVALFASFSFGLLLLQSLNPPGPTGADTTEIDPTAVFDDLLLDRDDAPDVYTGELVDITGDGLPDVALFGDPSAPIIRSLKEAEPDPRDWEPLYTVIGLLGVALITALIAPWATNRFKKPASAPDVSADPPALET